MSNRTMADKENNNTHKVMVEITSKLIDTSGGGMGQMTNQIAGEMTSKMADEMASKIAVETDNRMVNEMIDEIAVESTDDMLLSTQSSSNGDDTDTVEIEPSITTVSELSNAEESNFAETEHTNKTGKSCHMFSSIPDLSGKSDWYSQKCFQRYWDHYNYVMSWCKKHYKTYNKLTERQKVNQTKQRHQENCYTQYPWGHGVSPYHPYWGGVPWQQGQCQTEVKISRNSRRQRSRQKKEEQNDTMLKEKIVKNEEEPVEISGSDTFEMELTEDLIEFFSKSEKHRKQRDEKKKEERDREKKEPELVNLEDVQASPQRERTAEAPKERPGSRRTSEMKQLYGKGAAMIHGMETAIQMTFDRNKDLKQPKLWPNMPLKIVFN